MITIEEVLSIKDQFITDGITPASGETLREACDLAISQHEEILAQKACFEDLMEDHLTCAKANELQAEEIERLRAEINNWIEVSSVDVAKINHHKEEIERLRAANKDALAWFDDLKSEFDKVRRERDEAYERAAQACELERLHDGLNTAEDIAYGNAIADAAAAIRKLISK